MKKLVPGLLGGLLLLAAAPGARAQLGGVKTIAPAGSGANNYTTFTAAVAALNAQGVAAGGVTFDVAAGAVFDEVIPGITTSGSPTAPIIFRKSGSGANPVIQATGSGATDAALTLDGADYVQLTGIDVAEKAANTTPAQLLEYGYYLVNGATHNTISAATITLNRANTTRTAGVAMLNGGNDQNHFYGLTVQNSAYGYDLEGSATVYDDGTEIGPAPGGGGPASRVLSIGTPSGAGGITGIVYGIYLRSQTNARVSSTEVSGLTGASAVYGIYSTGANNGAEVSDCRVHGMSSVGSTGAVMAMYVNSGITHRFLRNHTYDLAALGTSGFAAGFDITAGTTNYLANNFVYDIRAAGSGAGTSVRAFSFRGGTNYAYHNTVVINYAATNPANKSGALYMSGSPTVDLRNNIFVNLVSGLPAGGGGIAAAFFKNTNTIAANLLTGTNNNIYYAGTPGPERLIFYGANTTTPALDQTLAQYKTRAGSVEQSSLTELPPFVNPTTDPHLQTGLPTVAESGGAPLGTSPLPVPTDIDLQARNLTTPDIGADEGSFLSGADLVPPTISYAPLTSAATLASRSLSSVAITDASGVNLTPGLRPRLYYRKKTDANVFGGANDNSGNGWKYTEAVGSASPFSFVLDVSKLRSAPVAGDSIFYFVAAQDVATPPNVGASPAAGFAATSVASITAAPTRPNAYRVLGLLSGIKRVGVSAAADYPTLSAAAADFNISELNGALTLQLIDTNYPSETYPITFQPNAGSSSANTTRIELGPGITTRSTFVAPVAATTPLLIVDASFVAIDGRLNAGLLPRLVFQNNGTAASSGAVFVTGASVTLRNLELVGSGPTAGYGAAFSGATNGIIRDCVVRRVATGIQAQSSCSNFVAEGNNLGNVGATAPLADKLGSSGITVLATTNFLLTGNIIVGITRSAANSVAGIVVGTTSTNGVVNRNLIRDVKHTGTTSANAYGAYGIRLAASSTTANIAVNCNMILDILSSGDDGISFTPHGIYVTGGGNYQLAYNSILLSGNVAEGATPASACIALANGVGAVRMVNNLLVNRLSLSGAAGRAYAFATANPAGQLQSNNNSYWAGANTQGRLANVNGTEVNTLAALRTATGQDQASVSVSPVFSSPAQSLLLEPSQNCSLNGAAQPLTGPTDDIEGQVRDTGTPDIGADEFVPTPLAAPAASSVTAAYGLPTPPLTATGTPGGTLVWYADAALTQRLFAGPSFNTGQTQVGSYTYFVVDSVNACRSAATSVTLSLVILATRAATLTNLTADLAPNPSPRGQASFLNLTGPARSLTVEVTDALGRPALAARPLRHPGGTATHPLPLPAGLAPGLYVLRLWEAASGHSLSRQLVIE
jgi:hypothetical protein